MMDERYAIGFCNVCTDAKPRKTPRPKSQFIRADLFNQADWDQRREKILLAKHVHNYASVQDGTAIMTSKAIYEMVTLFDKYGFAGMHITSGMRDIANDYAVELKKRRVKTQRSRGA